MKNKDKELRRLDKIAKLELMIEEYGTYELLSMIQEANDNISIRKLTDSKLNIKDNE